MLSKLACASRSLRRPSAVRALGLYQTSISSNLSSKLLFEKVAVSNKRYFSTSSLLSEQGQRVEQDAEGVTEIGGLHPISKTALRRMGIDKLFEVQAVTFQKTKIGNDLIVQAPTGSGKTLSFVLPVMEKLIAQAEKGRYRLDRARGQARPACLVIAPTRELATQIAEVFDDYIAFTRDQLPDSMRNIETCCVYGGAPMANQYRTLTQGNADIIIGTPGRLKAFLEEMTIDLNHLDILILDESDRMLDMGFKQDIETILRYSKKFSRARGRQMPNENEQNRQVLLYSATCPPWVKQAAKEFLSQDMEHLKLVDESQEIGGRNMNVHHYAIKVNSCKDMRNISTIINYLVEQITSEKQKASGENVHNIITRSLIFSRTRRQCDTLGRLINKSQVMHGQIPQYTRTQIYNDFKRGSITTVVATDLASRGIDIPDIDLVVQLEPPMISEIETYVHRSGRAGRAGKTGISIVLYDSSGDRTITEIERKTGIEFSEFLLPENFDQTGNYSSYDSSPSDYDDRDRGQNYGRNRGYQQRDRNYDRNDRYGNNHRSDNRRGGQTSRYSQYTDDQYDWNGSRNERGRPQRFQEEWDDGSNMGGRRGGRSSRSRYDDEDDFY